MALHRYLILLLSGLGLVLFAGMVALSLNATRSSLAQQSMSAAQRTANLLALSPGGGASRHRTPLSDVVEDVFALGHLRDVALFDANGTLLIGRQREARVDAVPAWFVALLDRHVSPGTAGFAHQGQPLRLTLRVDPAAAYTLLWRVLVRSLVWMVLAVALASVVGSVFLARALQPLKGIERQAEAISLGRYPLQRKMPKTRELSAVVQAINGMIGKLKEMVADQARTAERLRAQAFRDPLTGLGNRRLLQGELDQRIRSPEESDQGVVLLLKLHHLVEVNDRLGYQAGDRFLREAAAELVGALVESPGAIAVRLGGGDFGILLPEATAEEGRQMAEKLARELGKVRVEGLESADMVRVGGVIYDASMTPGEVMGRADLALRNAQQQGANAWTFLAEAETESGAALSATDWHEILRAQIERGDILLYAQRVVSSSADQVLHHELLARLPDQQGGVWSAGVFMPLVRRFGLERELDRLVVQSVLRLAASMDPAATFAVNLCPAILNDEPFCTWLLRELAQRGRGRARIVFEFSDHVVAHQLEAVRDLGQRLRKLGHGIAVDHFGRYAASFGYLQSLLPDYVKIDGIYVRELESDSDHRFFIGTLSTALHGLDIPTIAESVESRAEWDILRDLRVDGIQGFAAGGPEPVEALRATS